jgi:hypothetical protein
MKINKKELSKFIKEAYVKRYKYIDPNDRSSVKYEEVKAPSNLNIDMLKNVFERYYSESEEEIIKRKDPLALTKTITNFAKRRQILNYYNSLDSNDLYELQNQIYKSTRNKILNFVNSVLEANPKTRSDFPGNSQLVDATKRSKLMLTPNDLPEAEDIVNFDAMPFKSILRVVNDPQDDITGMPKGAIEYDKYGVRKEERLANTKATNYNYKTDPRQGADMPKEFIEFMPTGAV